MVKVKRQEKKGAKEAIVITYPKKNNKIYIIVGLVIILIAIVYGVYSMTGQKAQTGNTVKVDYIGALDDGTVFDTSIKEVGEQAKLRRPAYEPLEFTLGQGQLLKGFENAVIGMKEGETKTIKLNAEESYGEAKEELVLKGLKREIKSKRYSQVDKEAFKTVFQQEPTLGLTLERQELPWKIKISKLNETTVTLEGLAQAGTTIKLPGAPWDAQVRAVTEQDIVIFQNPKLGEMVSFPTMNGVISGKVVTLDAESFDVDTNHPLAGKSLTFKITLVVIKADKQ